MQDVADVALRVAACLEKVKARYALVGSVASDSILSKLIWYRDGGGFSDQQWRDILGVLRVSAARIDNAYLDEWASRLGLAALLQRAREQISAAD